MDNPEIAASAPTCDDAVLPLLLAEDADCLFWTPTRTGKMSAWWCHVPFAHWLVSNLKPRLVVELGTHSGVSFAAFCEAMQRQNIPGQCFAIDPWQNDAAAFQDLHQFIQQRYAPFAQLLRLTPDQVLSSFADGSIDLLHIDGRHAVEAVKQDFENWLPKLSPRAVVLFHGTNLREPNFGVWKLWPDLRERHPTFEFFHGHGLGVAVIGANAPMIVRALCNLTPQAALVLRARCSLIGTRWMVGEVATDATKRVSILSTENEHQRKSLAEQDALINAIYASTSWRVTRPLRTIKRLRRGTALELPPATTPQPLPLSFPTPASSPSIATETLPPPATDAAIERIAINDVSDKNYDGGASETHANVVTAPASEFIELNGLFYQEFLTLLHEKTKPKTYFEIGTLNGETLRLANCASISVDPEYQISCDVIGKKPSCRFFQTESDRFFAEHTPQSLFGAPIDLALLDGMHLFEFLLRDFINTERNCIAASVVVLHDCIPGDPYIAARSHLDPIRSQSSRPGYWTGDVWKILPALRKYRPDLRIVVVDAPPTGLVLITGVDPHNTILTDRYDAILEEFLPLDLSTYGVARLHEESHIVSTDTLAESIDIAEFFRRGQSDHKLTLEGKALYRYASPLAIAETRTGKMPAITIMRESPARDLPRPGPAFHDDPDGAELFAFADVKPNIIPHGPSFIVLATGLRQIGYRSYLTKNGYFFTDETLVNATETDAFLTRLGNTVPFLNEETGLSPSHDKGEFAFDPQDRKVVYLPGETISLGSFEPSNYGAFLFRVLPKLAGRTQWLAGRKVLTPCYNESMRSLFALAGVTADQLIPHDTGLIYHFEQAVIPSLRNAHAHLDAETVAFFADLRERFGSWAGARKIFVSRASWNGSYAAQTRRMLNEAALQSRLEAEGFVTIQPHAMTVRAQIEAFSSANVIVGAAGSGMFNAVFSRPGTKIIDIESEPHWIFTHINLFGSCGLDYGIFEAKAADNDWGVPHKPFTVNIDALMNRLAAL